METGRKIYFDAFVCYTAADAEFVKEMLYNLENIHGLRLCLKERDMVAGGADNVMLAELVKSRYICLTLTNSSSASLNIKYLYNAFHCSGGE